MHTPDSTGPNGRDVAIRESRRRFLVTGLKIAIWTAPVILTFYGTKAYAIKPTTCMPATPGCMGMP